MKDQIIKRLTSALAKILPKDYWGVSLDCGDEESGVKFLQFISARTLDRNEVPLGRMILLDLPCDALSWDEHGRAIEAFKRRGTNAPEEIEAANSAGDKRIMLATWRMPLGIDPQVAAEIAVELMTEIYGVSSYLQWESVEVDVFEMLKPLFG